MADISISPVAPREFRVQVREGDRETTHQVTVPDRLGEGLELREGSERQGMAEPPAAKQIHRRDVLGGLIHEYERPA